MVKEAINMDFYCSKAQFVDEPWWVINQNYYQPLVVAVCSQSIEPNHSWWGRLVVEVLRWLGIHFNHHIFQTYPLCYGQPPVVVSRDAETYIILYLFVLIHVIYFGMALDIKRERERVLHRNLHWTKNWQGQQIDCFSMSREFNRNHNFVDIEMLPKRHCRC